MLQNFLTTVLSKAAVHKTMDEYEKEQKENIGTLKPPKFVFGIGAISMAISLAVILLTLLFVRDAVTVIFCAVVFGILFLLGLFLVCYERNFMAMYKKDEIIYRNIFRKVRKFSCADIAHAYYKDRGGIQFVFKDGRKLSFDKEERVFYMQIVKGAQVQCKYKGEDNPVVKVYYHPFFMCPCWLFCGGMLLGTVWEPSLFVIFVFALVFCLGCQLSYTTYDKKKKILTRTRWGFSKKYDMKFHLAKPVYENQMLMVIEIYKYDKKVGKIPVSVEYKNRAELIREICRVSV